jgi:hypothetical protein
MVWRAPIVISRIVAAVITIGQGNRVGEDGEVIVAQSGLSWLQRSK